jgi:hypothetical protein
LRLKLFGLRKGITPSKTINSATARKKVVFHKISLFQPPSHCKTALYKWQTQKTGDLADRPVANYT